LLALTRKVTFAKPRTVRTTEAVPTAAAECADELAEWELVLFLAQEEVAKKSK
jgi:hypothetical protein